MLSYFGDHQCRICSAELVPSEGPTGDHFWLCLRCGATRPVVYEVVRGPQAVQPPPPRPRIAAVR